MGGREAALRLFLAGCRFGPRPRGRGLCSAGLTPAPKWVKYPSQLGLLSEW
jgi:hypothetical protein